MMEMDYTLYNIRSFDIVVNPGFGATIITNTIFPLKNVMRKKKIENLLDNFDKSSK
jgi:hypothetical protein